MIKLPSRIVEFMNMFAKNGYRIYVVGGAVRDLLLGRKSIDEEINWDFTTDATPDEILKMFPDGFYNNTFGTVGIKFEDEIFEVTTHRKEGTYSDTRHPDSIEWAKTIEEDLSRRDFTINALAFDGKNIIDPFQGQNHIKQKLIVAVGDPDKRFSEDALRLMRAVRLSAELGFLLDEKTRESIRQNAHLIQKISKERVRDELFKILKSDNPAEGILFLRSTGILEQILPEVDICFTIPQKSPKRHHIYDVGTHMAMALKHCPSKDPLVRFAALLHDVGKAQTFRQDKETGLITFFNHEVVGERQANEIANRLKMSKKDKEKLALLVRHHQFTVQENQTDKAVRRFIRDIGKENIQDMLDIRTADRLGSGSAATSWRLDLFKKRLVDVQTHVFSITDLKINGEDVMKELHIQPGPKVGQVLKRVFEEIEEGKLKNEREQLIEFVKNSFPPQE